MHTASYEFLMKPKESARCHQTSPRGWGLGTRLLMFCQTVRTTNAHARERARVIAAQSQDARLAHGYTARKCPSRYPVMKRSRSYCQTVTWLYRQTVSQSSHVTAWHSRSYCSTHFWYVSCFTFLCLAGCSLTDAARPRRTFASSIAMW